MIDVARACSALGNETRRAILRAIFRGSIKTCCDRFELWESGVCVGDVVSAFGLSQSTISHHLSILEKAGLVRRETRGLWTCYFPRPVAVEELIAAIRADFLDAAGPSLKPPQDPGAAAAHGHDQQ